MRAALDELVTRRLRQGAAVPGFTCYGADTALAVVAAAEQVGAPVILLVAPSTAAAAAARCAAGVVVEAELGSVPGAEDQAAEQDADAAGKTDPALVRPFLDAGGARLLACGVGNVHGRYRGTPEIDWPRLERIRVAAGAVPLVLHGASGRGGHADLHRSPPPSGDPRCHRSSGSHVRRSR